MIVSKKRLGETKDGSRLCRISNLTLFQASLRGATGLDKLDTVSRENEKSIWIFFVFEYLFCMQLKKKCFDLRFSRTSKYIVNDYFQINSAG